MSQHPYASAIGHWPKGIGFDGGFRILGTPLGLGNAADASLRFLSHVDGPMPKRGSRVLLSPFVAAAIDSEGRGLDALQLSYDRKIRLGRMDIRMLSAGLGPGSSQIEITLKNRIIVYADGIRLAQPIEGDIAVVPTCDLLLLNVEPAEPKPPSPRRSASNLVGWITETCQRDEIPVLCAHSLGTALDVAWALRETNLKIIAQRSLFEMLKRVESAGYALGKLRRLEQWIPSSGIVLRSVFDSAEDLQAWAQNSKKRLRTAFIGAGRTKPDWAEVGFRLGEGEDRPGLVAYAKKTQATEVALSPRCDDALEALLAKAGLRVYRIRKSTQMSLDF